MPDTVHPAHVARSCARLKYSCAPGKKHPHHHLAKTIGDFLLHLDHANVAFSHIVVEWHDEVIHKRQHFVFMGNKPIQQVSGFTLLEASTHIRHLHGREIVALAPGNSEVVTLLKNGQLLP